MVALLKKSSSNISLCKEDLVRFVAWTEVCQHLPVDVHLLHCPHINLGNHSGGTATYFLVQ